MERVSRLADLISRLGGHLAAGLLIYIVVHGLIEIVLRGAFGTSTYLLAEYAGYAMAAMTFLSLGYALESGALIRVSLLTGALRGWPRRLIELVCCVLTLGAAAYIAWHFLLSALRNFAQGRVSYTSAATPLWIPDAVVVAGLVVFCLQLLAYLLRTACREPAGGYK